MHEFNIHMLVFATHDFRQRRLLSIRVVKASSFLLDNVPPGQVNAIWELINVTEISFSEELRGYNPLLIALIMTYLTSNLRDPSRVHFWLNEPY